MTRYIIERVLYALLTLFVLVTLTFFMMHAMPGDPFTGDRKLTEQVKHNLEVKYGLDKPLLTQYGIYWKNILTGDFGDSIVYAERSVMDMFAQAWPYSVQLGVYALVLSIIFGLLFGVLAALNPGKPADAFVMLVAVIGISVPGFIIGALLQYWLGLKLGNVTLDLFNVRLFSIGGWGDWHSIALPVIAASLSNMASTARTMRTSMLDELTKDYIKTARAKGVGLRRIVTNHLLRNSILPIVTNLSYMISGALMGSFVIENIFNIPGIGKLFTNCVISYDYPMIMAMTIIIGLLLIACNLLVDILYCFVDPRIRLDRKGVI